MKKVLLVKQCKAAFEPSELLMLLQQAQANGVKGAKVHLVQVELYAQLCQSVGNTRSQLARRLFREGHSQQGLWRHTFARDEVDKMLDQGERLAGFGS